MIWPEIITALKDVLVALAAATTGVVAILGLKGWRRELKGRAEFDIARRLLKSTYALRDRLSSCRSPFVSGGEFPEGYRGRLGGTSAEEKAKAWIHVYSNRWKPVWEALQEFDAATLEAEVLWGETLRTSTDKLRACVQKLRAAIDAFISNAASNGEDFKADKDFGKQIRSEVYGPTSDKDNALTQQITSAVKDIEDAVRPHLRRS